MSRTTPNRSGTNAVHTTWRRSGKASTLATVATLTRYQIHGWLSGSADPPAVAIGQRMSASGYTSAKIPANRRTPRPARHATSIAASGTNVITMSGTCQPGLSWPGPSAAKNACAPRATLPRPTTMEMIRSMRRRVKDPRPAVVSLV